MYKKGQAARLGPRPNTPYPRTQGPENTQLRPDSVGATYPIPAQASGDKDKKKKWSKKAIPKGEGLQFPGKQRNQGLPWVLHFFFLIKTFFKSAQTKPN